MNKMINNEQQSDLAHLRPMNSDEIDLGLLIRNLLAQWKLILSITVLGAVVGIIVALMIPKQYRVEAVFDKPSNSQLSALLSQQLIELDRQQILGSFLRNLKSQQLIEQVLEANQLFTDENGNTLNEQQRYSRIQEYTSAIRIAPAEFDFLPELEDQPKTLDQVSYSLLTTDTETATTLLNGLLKLAATKTTNEFASDVNGAKSIEIAKMKNQLAQLTAEAEAKRTSHLGDLNEALAIAKALNINEPSDRSVSAEDLYLKGTRALSAEIEAAKNAPLKLGSIIVGYDEAGNPQFETAEAIKGKIGALQKYSLNIADIEYIAPNVRATAPSNAEKPNRKLIAVASTVLAGFLGLFIALIRLAIHNKDA